jgi:hypothetical protein
MNFIIALAIILSIGIVYGVTTYTPPITAGVVSNPNVLSPQTNVTSQNYITIINNVTTMNCSYINNITNIVMNITNNITNNITMIFNYNDYFNQALNTTSDVTFNSITGYNTTIQLKSYFDTQYYSINNPNNYINNSFNDKYYGEVYNTSDYTITMTTRYVYYNYTALQTGYMYGFTNTGQYLIANNSGIYKITLSLHGEVNNNDDVIIIMNKNDLPIQKSNVSNRYENGLDAVISISFIETLSQNDTLNLQIADQTRNGAIFTFHNINFDAVRIG